MKCNNCKKELHIKSEKIFGDIVSEKFKDLKKENKELKKKIKKIKEIVIETIQELNNEKSGYQVSDHAKNILDNILGEFYKERTEG